MRAEIAAFLDRRARTVEPGLYSVLERPAGARYDHRARLYDRLVGSQTYNRMVWRTPVVWHREVAARAAASASGPLLEGGCGTALFTREAWTGSGRPLLLLDRSVDMLRVARERVGGAATLLQADLFDLPVRPGTFATVCSFGVVHVLDDPAPALRGLWSAVAPGGELWITGIVTVPHVPARAWYAALRLAGEAAPPRSTEALARTIEHACGVAPQVEGSGAFALFRVRKEPGAAPERIG